MAATTNDSRDQALAALEARLGGTDDLELSRQLFAMLQVLDSSAALRRALTDPSRTDEAKEKLVRELFGTKVSEPALETMAGLAASRWSAERDLGDTLEELAATAAIVAAEKSGGAEALDALSEQLLAFEDAVAADHDLQWAFEDQSAPVSAKVELARKLTPHASEVARELITQAVTSPRGLKLTAVIERFAELVAKRQRRWIATVSVTRPLTEDQLQRLERALNAMYGRELRLNVVEDPALVGGLRIEVGDEVLDASAATRLAELRRKLA